MIDDRAVEAAARAIYELDPFHEGGEYVDGHCVSPGGNLTWEQACARDAEFVDVTFMLPVTQPAREAARAALHAAAPFLTQIPDGWKTIDTAPKDGTRIWLYWPENYVDDQQSIGWWHKAIDGPRWIDNADSDFNGQPTYWQPLPLPPPTEKNDG